MQNRDHLRRLTNIWDRFPIYFITICTHHRLPRLTQSGAPDILVSAWRESEVHYGWFVGKYVIMPDHVHFFARPGAGAKPLSAFMRDWKRWTSNRILELNPAKPLWQPEFFDHILRSPKCYGEKWLYVRENPVRAGLVGFAEQWPYAGECSIVSF